MKSIKLINRNSIKHWLFTLVIFLVSIVSLNAQTISGNTVVTPGSTHVYTFTPATQDPPFQAGWIISGHSSYSNPNGLYQVRVTWSDSPGSGLVKFTSLNVGTAQLSVSIIAPPPPPPPPSVRNTTMCGLGTLTMEAYGAPSGSTYKWYRENNTFIKNGRTLDVTFNISLGNPIQEKRFKVSYVKDGVHSAKRLVRARSVPFPELVDAGPDLTVCLNDPSVALGGIPSGGGWNGNGVSSGYFSPASAGVGTHTITYRYTNQHGCSKSDTQRITVKNLPKDTAGEDTGLFENQGLYNLSIANTNPNITDKSWSGPGVVNGGPMFDPSVANAANTITYTYSDGNCTNSDTRILYVYPNPEITHQRDPVLSDDKPAINLVINRVYPHYQWYRNNIPVQGATLGALYVTSPGVYKVKITLQGGATRFTDPVAVFRNSDLVNYVRAHTVQKENLIGIQDVVSASADEVRVSTNYIDGLGRPIQSVAKQSSPERKDMVAVMAYDQFGRESKKYLPYISTYGSGFYKDFDISDTSNPQYQFYQTANDKVANTTAPWAMTSFEPSPLNRPLKQGAPGEDWQLGTGHTQQLTYRTNITSDDVVIWKKGNNSLMSTESYPENSLTVNEVRDENGHTKITYTDKLGRKVMDEMEDGEAKWARTYYVYDSFGRVIGVIPPITVDGLGSNYPKTISQEILDRECYQYEFDYRGRNIVKKLPGADKITMVYDRWDRLVFSQDGNQRLTNQWSFTKYDRFDRPVITGVKTITGDRETVQQQVDNFYAQIQANGHLRYEALGTGTHGYTNISYPHIEADDQVLSVTYYDTYDFTANPQWNGPAELAAFQPTIGITDHIPNTKGQITGTKIKILDKNVYLFNVNFYDKKYRLVQTAATNHLNGQDRYTTKYDFIGNILEDYRLHSSLDNQLTIHKEYTYDHQGRELRTYHTINNGDRILLSENKYNEIGQLIEKNLHSTSDGQQFLQSIDYRYNIRGWLKSINNPELAVNPENNDDSNDLFGMEILYNEASSNLGNTPSYNRNISAITWRNAQQNEKQAYSYSYDPVNRLKTAQYINLTNPANNGMYNVGGNAGILYDKNGNILHLVRKGLMGTSIGTIDDLQYEYSGNQLLSVNDLGDHTLGFKMSASSSGGTPPDPNQGPPIIPGNDDH